MVPVSSTKGCFQGTQVAAMNSISHSNWHPLFEYLENILLLVCAWYFPWSNPPAAFGSYRKSGSESPKASASCGKRQFLLSGGQE